LCPGMIPPRTAARRGPGSSQAPRARWCRAGPGASCTT
jgi:hypothetical protein